MASPDEVIRELAQRWNIEISRGTLQRWTNAGLVPEPVTGSLGRGRGRFTDYPEGTAEQAAASWWVLHMPGIRPAAQMVAEAREAALRFHEAATEGGAALRAYLRNVTPQVTPRLEMAWLNAWRKALASWPLDRPARLVYQYAAPAGQRATAENLRFTEVQLEAAEQDVLDIPAILADR